MTDSPSTEPASQWQQYVASLPSNFGSLVNLDLQGDRPDDAVSFLKLLYHQAKGDKSPAELLTSASQAVGAARFSHKYAATMQLKTCDQYLYDH
ncbi:hypothetical protein WJX84_000698, partial [Apatococcus fuscideae]